MTTVPSTPSTIRGVPAGTYPTWRRGQRKAVDRVLSSSARFVHVHGVPGSGKTLTNMAVAGLTSGRVLYLTNTRALVPQLGDFGFSVIEGHDNYSCREGEGHLFEYSPTHARPKEAGKCSARYCLYRAARTAAQKSDRVTTNYTYNALAGVALGEFDLVICDEAHKVESWLSTWLEFELDLRDVRRCGITPPKEKGVWVDALATILPFLEEITKEKRKTAMESRSNDWRKIAREVARLELLCRRIKHIYETRWVCIRLDHHAVTFSPDDVAPYAARKVWRRAPKVVLSSASLMPSTLLSLGIKSTDVDRVDLPSTFDYSRRPILFVEDKPRLRISRSTTDDTYEELQRRVGIICEAHKQAKGIIHSHSYDLNHRLSGAHPSILTHLPGQPVPLDQFRRASAPSFLMSPTITEGIDLPYDDCRVIILPRMLFANPSDPVNAARMKRIPPYLDDLAAMGFIQAVDRGMRAEDDACVVYILDAHWTWWKRRVRWSAEVGGSFGRTTLREIIDGADKVLDVT